MEKLGSLAVIDAILVCLNYSENYRTGIYYYFTCFICANISRQSKLLLPQFICRVREGFFVFCLVLVLLWFNEACRRNKQKYEGKNQPHAEAILLQLDMSHMHPSLLPRYITRSVILSVASSCTSDLLYNYVLCKSRPAWHFCVLCAACNPYKPYLFIYLHAPNKRLQYSFIILCVYDWLSALGMLHHIATWC